MSSKQGIHSLLHQEIIERILFSWKMSNVIYAHKRTSGPNELGKTLETWTLNQPKSNGNQVEMAHQERRLTQSAGWCPAKHATKQLMHSPRKN